MGPRRLARLSWQLVSCWSAWTYLRWVSLHSALCLIPCFASLQSAAQGRQDYEALEMELNTLFHSLEEWLSGTTPVQMTASITNLSK